MKSFGQFLKESDELLLKPDLFPILLSTSIGAARLPKLISDINAALTTGKIENAKFVGMKQNLSTILDRIRFNHNPQPHWLDEILKWAYLNDIDFMQANHAAGKIGLTQKILRKEPDNEKAKKFIEYALEVSTIHHAMEDVKKLAVKRTAAAPEDPKQKYIAPMAAKEAGRKVIAVLTELTDEIKIEYIKQVFENSKHVVTEFFELRDDSKKMTIFSRQNPQIQMFRYRVYDLDRKGDPIGMQAGWEQYLQNEADKAGQFMQDEFLAKNAKKLAKIVELKDNLQACTIIGQPHVMGRGIGGEIAFTFTDHSSFIVRNAVKWNTSSSGKFFNQFPTTFHDVVLPDGKAMPQPSEQRMIEVFAVTH